MLTANKCIYQNVLKNQMATQALTQTLMVSINKISRVKTLLYVVTNKQTKPPRSQIMSSAYLFPAGDLGSCFKNSHEPGVPVKCYNATAGTGLNVKEKSLIIF